MDTQTLPDNVLTTQLKKVVNWARRSSIWPMPFATACCGIELMATASSRFDLARFGAEAMRFSPRQSDLTICGVLDSYVLLLNRTSGVADVDVAILCSSLSGRRIQQLLDGGGVHVAQVYHDRSRIETRRGKSTLGGHGGGNHALVAKEVGILHYDALQRAIL